ncbi:hypothetical protein SAMN02982997_02511 [Legionella micdadei]|uniref:Ribosome biogenesis protein n=1 Tax=Legionella micdadei TaxID=451 RepID=A0A1G5HZM2_LEGMI|nr:hypothetical protein Lmic_1891 [Legionella micdadei]SCY69256.1 hypothetical protein SAMN02982997_02511 [Legionella micdadei]
MAKYKSYECYFCHSVRLQPGRTCQSCGARTLVAANKNNKRSKVNGNYEEKYSNWRKYTDFLTEDNLSD